MCAEPGKKGVEEEEEEEKEGKGGAAASGPQLRLLIPPDVAEPILRTLRDGDIPISDIVGVRLVILAWLGG